MVRIAAFVILLSIWVLVIDGKPLQLEDSSLQDGRRVLSRQLATQASNTVAELKISNAFLSGIANSTYSIDATLDALQEVITQRDSELIKALEKIEAAVSSSSDVLRETVAQLSNSVTGAVGQVETSIVSKMDESIKENGSKLDKLITLVGYGDPYDTEIKSLPRS